MTTDQFTLPGLPAPVPNPSIGTYVAGVDHCPRCQRGPVLPFYYATADRQNLRTEDGFTYWQCCFTVCLGCAESDDTPHVYADADACDNCDTHMPDACDCHACPSCGDKTEDMCSECEWCEDCCACDHCSYCNHVGSVCETCNHCGDHCECHGCDNCGVTVECSDYCHDCDACESCCSCNESSGRMGRSTETGWTRRGVKVEVSDETVDLDQWRKIDPVRSMADFYLLSYMSATADVVACVNADYTDALSAIVDVANTRRDALIKSLDGPFTAYLDMAIGGEIRHHKAIQGLSSDRMQAWGQWQSVRAQVGPDALMDAAELFEEMGAGYGGELWATAARILHSHITGAMPAWLFVDRVFTMVHNGGSMLNKVEWTNDTPLLGETSLCQKIGNAHAAEVTDLPLLMLTASRETVALFYQWWTARNRAYVSMNRRPVVRPSYADRIVQRGYHWYIKVSKSPWADGIMLKDSFRAINYDNIHAA